MSSTSSNAWTGWKFVYFFMACFVVFLILFFIFMIIFPDSDVDGWFFGAIFCTFISVIYPLPPSPVWCVFFAIKDYRDRPETKFKSGEVLGGDTLDIYTPTPKQWDTVTQIYRIEEVGEYAECPYCGSNIRDTFDELGGIIKCNKCGAFHHKECFEYYGRKCGSSSCKLRDT